ncbi:hypothetical protein [Azospirillum himalayense]|uniref:Uncharacterized protein n=1 Tax=Azospirillum himalayense TaxID=654847 RepID=A0ABW0G0B6_9PROT
MKRFETREQQDGSHVVVKGRIGQYGKGDTIPRAVVWKMLAGRPADMGNGYIMAAKGGSPHVH